MLCLLWCETNGCRQQKINHQNDLLASENMRNAPLCPIYLFTSQYKYSHWHRALGKDEAAFKSGFVHRTVPPKLVVFEHTGQPQNNSLQTSSIYYTWPVYIHIYDMWVCERGEEWCVHLFEGAWGTVHTHLHANIHQRTPSVTKTCVTQV